MSVWYKTDVTRLSGSLLRAQSVGQLGYLALLLRHKLLRREPAASVGVKLDDAFLPIDLHEIPEPAQTALQDMIDACSQRACRLSLCHTSEFLGDAESYGANLLHASGKIWLAALWFRVGRRVEAGFSLSSQLADGTILTTTNLRRRSDLPPGMETRSYPGASLDELWDRHQELVHEFGEQTVVSFDESELLHHLVDVRQRIRRFHLARGILKPMTRCEIERLDPNALAAFRQDGNVSEAPGETIAGEAEASVPSREDAWRVVLRNAWLGLLVGAMLGQYLLSQMEAPRMPTTLELLLIEFYRYGWALVFAAAGAAIGYSQRKNAPVRAAVDGAWRSP